MTSAPASVPIALGRVPLLGHIPALARQPLPFLQDVRTRGEVVLIYLGTLPVYVVNAPHLIQAMMVEQVDQFEKGRLFDRARAFIGNGITGTSGEVHARQRRIMQPAFSHGRIAEYVKTMSELARARAESWRPGQLVALDEELHHLALAIATRTLISSDLEEKTGPVMNEAVPRIFESLPWRTIVPSFVERLPTPGNRRFRQSVAELYARVGETITTYRRHGTDHGDLLSRLIGARDPHTGAVMDDRQISDEVMAVLLGGYGAVKCSLTWFFLELSAHPDIEAKVHAEIDSVVGTTPPRYEDLPRLAYTQQVINEVLRRHHVSLMLMRRTRGPVTLGTVDLPTGAELMFSQVTLHRDPVLFPDPLRFDPDRWAPGWKTRLPQGAFIPFSVGPHQCIGAAFATAEMAVIAAAIAARWQLRLQPGVKIREVVSALIQPDRAPMITIAR